MSDYFNGDLRTIYQQEYLSPRPQTVSCRLGSDGYSPWTFYYWNRTLPNIAFEKVPALLSQDDQGKVLMTTQKVPFRWNDSDKNIAFTSQWDNWQSMVTVPVKNSAEVLWLLVCGSTNPMQCGIANAELRMKYLDGKIETLELVHPDNFWTLCPLAAHATAVGQGTRGDYMYERDGFSLPKVPPETVELGEVCRAMLYSWKLRSESPLESVTLETLSQEVVIGLMGVTLMNPN
jgi:hypothetical protein